MKELNNNRVLYWELLDVCQLKCRYCYYDTGFTTRRMSMLDFNQAKKIVPELSKYFNKIVLTGGEVLLYPNIFGLIKELTKFKISVSLITDGLKLSEDIIKKLIRYGVEEISVSLDSFDSLQNAEVRISKVGNPIIQSQNIIKNVLFLVSHYSDIIPITILQSICNKNIHSIPEMSSYANENMVRHLVHPVGIIDNSNNTQDINLFYLDKESLLRFKNDFFEWAEQKKEYLDFYDIVLKFLEGDSNVKVKCNMGVDNFFIDLSGTIFPCFYTKEFNYGNIYKGDLINIIKFKRPSKIETSSCASLACACMLKKK